MKLENSPIMRAVAYGFFEVRQVALLCAIVERPGLSVRDYSDQLGITKPCVTRAITTLEAQGYIKRSQSPHDRRLLVLNPTAEGCDAVEEVMQETAPTCHNLPAAVC